MVMRFKHIFSREALAAVSAFNKKKKTSMPWNADLMIGSSHKIPISAYKLVSSYPTTVTVSLSQFTALLA